MVKLRGPLCGCGLSVQLPVSPLSCEEGGVASYICRKSTTVLGVLPGAVAPLQSWIAEASVSMFWSGWWGFELVLYLALFFKTLSVETWDIACKPIKSKSMMDNTSIGQFLHFGHTFWHPSGTHFGIVSDIISGICSDILSDKYFDIVSESLTYSLYEILSGIHIFWHSICIDFDIYHIWHPIWQCSWPWPGIVWQFAPRWVVGGHI